MKKVVLGKPQNPGDFEQRHRWLLHSMHEIELASAVRDPELDAIEARLDAIEARLDAIDARFDNYTPTLIAATTYDPPNLGPNSSVNTIVSVPGAVMEDAAVATFSLAPGDVIIRAVVSADDEVTVNFLNPTSGAEDLDEGTIKVIVFKLP